MLSKTKTFACSLLVLVAGLESAHAADIRVFSGGAPQVGLQAMAPEFESATGHRLHFTFALVTDIQKKLASGDKADLILLPEPLIALADKVAPLRREGRTPLARVGIGVIVPMSAATPDISSPASVRQALIDARSVVFARPDTPSGAHLARMLSTLGIEDAIRPKLVVKAAIDGGAELVARREADLGMFLLSEVLSVGGLEVAGLLPPALQSFVVYASAIPESNTSPDAALSLIDYMTSQTKGAVWQSAGFELLQR